MIPDDAAIERALATFHDAVVQATTDVIRELRAAGHPDPTGAVFTAPPRPPVAPPIELRREERSALAALRALNRGGYFDR